MSSVTSTTPTSGAPAASTQASNKAASLDKGEITDKGSLNQRAVLQHRKDLVEELYSAEMSSRVIVARPKR